MKIVTKDGVPIGVEPETPEEEELARVMAGSDSLQWLHDLIAAETSGPN